MIIQYGCSLPQPKLDWNKNADKYKLMERLFREFHDKENGFRQGTKKIPSIGLFHQLKMPLRPRSSWPPLVSGVARNSTLPPNGPMAASGYFAQAGNHFPGLGDPEIYATFVGSTCFLIVDSLIMPSRAQVVPCQRVRLLNCSRRLISFHQQVF
jgi:hypothetical protein